MSEKQHHQANYENQSILPVDITSEMQKSYINYAMSVIVARALPDVRDGLKPVHRRILYTMYEDGLVHEKPFRKAATTVGAVLGRYHPHGDASVYDALVRMAQDFSLRYPLIEGHGNFGSIDGDPPAAYRYTEARMSPIAAELLRDIERETVDFAPNFDEQHQEPTVLAARLPTLLINGSAGIAVGMATNIPPHNLTEVVNAAICLIDNPEATLDELMQHVKGPDFPTGGIILGTAGIREAFATGRGRIRVRGRTEIVEDKGRYHILITEIPYQVSKAKLVERIADCVKDKRISGISGLVDESGRHGLKVNIELKREANPQVVLNQLYQYTMLQDAFSVNFLALVDGEPKILGLRETLRHYVDFQIEIVERRTRFDLRKAEERAHLLEGLRIAVDHIDEIIRVIRTSYDNARDRLMEIFSLSQVQAQAILEMQLRRLQGLEREKIEKEYAELTEKIAEYRRILSDRAVVCEIIKQECIALRDKYGDARRTSIEIDEGELDLEDLIEEEDCIITRSHFGYVKRQPMSAYRAQRRGGRGVTGMTTREEDYVEEIFIANTHSHLLFFTDRGRVYRLKGYHIPEAGRTAKGTNMINLVPLEQDEKITTVLHLRDFSPDRYLVMATRRGTVKRTALPEYDTARKGGLIAILLEEGDGLVDVRITDGRDSLLLCTRLGKAIHFDERDVRVMGRPAHGVRGILLDEGDYVVAMCRAQPGSRLLSVTELGYGKRSELAEYRLQTRGGKGLLNYHLTDKTGAVAGAVMAADDEDIMLVGDDGVVIRIDVAEIPVYSRVTQGVRVMRLDEGTRLVTVTRADKEPEVAELNGAGPSGADPEGEGIEEAADPDETT
ncbi:MAG: DNA gyrase subunit A [Clostridiales bacterium]|nr:DNA gyrase subunit A [Clostridiales bacterium]